MFPIIEVPDDAADLTEQLGTKPKFWFQNADGENCLFKEARPGTGEDWSEKVACEICTLLDIPHAHYDLAVWKDRRGVVTPIVVPEGGQLIHGNELLGLVDPSYPQEERFHVRQHTIGRVVEILKVEGIHAPPGWVAFGYVGGALDVFVGYLLLDALIANQDRHHQNWSLLLLPPNQIHLSPTYDHASSLGRNESDSSRMDRLTTRDEGRTVRQYVRRGESAFYKSPYDARPLSTLGAFEEAGKIRLRAANAWLDRLADVPLEAFRGIFDQVPRERITPVAVDFAMKMIEINRERLLNLRGSLR